MKELAKRNKTLTAIIVTITTIGSLYGAFQTIGIDLPRPAWSHELKQVAENQTYNRLDFLYFKQRQVKAEYYDLRSRIDNYPSETVPEYLRHNRVLKEEELQRIEAEIKKLESK